MTSSTMKSWGTTIFIIKLYAAHFSSWEKEVCFRTYTGSAVRGAEFRVSEV